MKGSVKFLDGSEDAIEILAIPFGGPIGQKADGTGGKDGDGEYFTAKTDLCLDWFPAERPLLYHHGLDSGPGTDVIGRVDCKSLRTDDDGHWVTAQLDKRSRYYAQVKKLIEADALGGSSGAMPHLVKRAKDGHLDRWPWVEESLTPSPCNPYSTVGYAEAAKHYKSLDLDLPDPATLLARDAFGPDWEANFAAVKAKLDAEARGSLDDADFAYIDSDGGKHLPINDASHVRNALARFDQTHFESASAKAAARRKIAAAAKRFGVDAADPATKADSSIPAEEANGDSSEGSYEDLISDIARAANGRFQTGGVAGLPVTGYAYPVATFPAGGAHQPGYAILRCGGYGDDDDTGYYRVDFTIGPDGDPLLGSATPMSKVYVPAEGATKALAATLTATPLAIAASEAVRQIKALGAQAAAVRQRRQEDGRDLSDGNRQHLAALADDLARVAGAIKALLVPREQAAAAAAPALDDADQRLRLLEAELALLLAE